MTSVEQAEVIVHVNGDLKCKRQRRFRRYVRWQRNSGGIWRLAALRASKAAIERRHEMNGGSSSNVTLRIGFLDHFLHDLANFHSGLGRVWME